MTIDAAALAWMQHSLAEAFIVFLRIGAVMAVMPAFGERMIPARVRLAVAFGFTLIVLPAVPVTAPEGDGFALLLRFVGTETVAGLVIGIGMRLFVLALQTAGSIAAQSTSLSQILGGAAVEPLPAMGHVLVIGGLALAVMADLHVRAAQLLILSYDILPAGRLPGAGVISQWGVAQVAQAFRLAFVLAVPFVIVSVLYNLTLGVINRAMPQLMVAFVGAPVITFGGLFLLMLLAPFLLSVWLEAFNGFLANPFGAAP